MLPGAKLKKRLRTKLLLSIVLGFMIAAALVGDVFAIARGYTTQDQGLQAGMVASLSSGGDNEVERASQENSSRIVGIVTTANDSLVTVGSANSKVLVEGEGQVEAYVSDINGEIHQGDLLTISPLKGVFMKALDSDDAIAIAAAQASETALYEYRDGNETKQTKVGRIPVDLNQKSNQSNQKQTSSLNRLSRQVVGKDVGEIRVLVAIIIFIIVLIAEIGILYGAISSAITAVGRNPLAKKIIRGELLRVVMIAFVILLFGLASVYAILWV